MSSPLTRLLQSRTSSVYRTRRFDNQTDVVYTFNAEGSEDAIDLAPYEVMWKKQPHLRTVIDFLARNVAQIGLHTYTREGDSSVRKHEGVLAALLRRPNDRMTQYDLLYSLVGDFALYNRAYWLVLKDPARPEGWRVEPVPPTWVTVEQDTIFHSPVYWVGAPGAQQHGKFGPDEVIDFKAWVPGDPTDSVSPVESLRLTLEEQHHARVYRKQVWRNSGRFGLLFTRPNDAPKWDNSARRRFMEMVREFAGNKGTRAGEGPILEDGMDAKRLGFSSADEEWAESTKLSLATCAQVYHVNPTMIGLLDNANFANVREFRRSLYGDTLGPYITMVEQRLNAFFAPLVGAPADDYLEFNVESKLRGSFEEQAAVVSTATGRPWQTLNEARKLFNLPPLLGGDEIITPLNVLVGNQASPQDGESERPTNPPVPGGEGEDEETPPLNEDEEKALTDVWTRTVQRQAKSAVPKIQAGDPLWWDFERWDRELALDLEKAGVPNALQWARVLNNRTEEEIRSKHAQELEESK